MAKDPNAFQTGLEEWDFSQPDIGKTDFSTPDDVTTEELGQYINWFVKLYKLEDTRDEELWEAFGIRFEEWDEAMFARTPEAAQIHLVNYLKRNGVNLVTSRTQKAPAELAAIVKQEEPRPWTKEEIQKMMEEAASQDKFITKHGRRQTLKIPKPDNIDVVDRNTTIFPISGQGRSYGGTHEPQLVFDQGMGFGQNREEMENFSDHDSDIVDENIPAMSHVSTTRNQSATRDTPGDENQQRALANLLKGCPNDTKYGGSEDSLEKKWKEFEALCGIAGVMEKSYITALPMFLKNGAKDFYYDNMEGHGYGYREIINLIKNEFESDQYMNSMQDECRDLTLHRVILKYPDKSKLECLDILAKDIRRIQRNLHQSYHTDRAHRDKLNTASSEIKECSFACFAPATTYQKLLSDLRNSLYTKVKLNNFKEKQIHLQDKDEADKKYQGTKYQQRGSGSSPHRTTSAAAKDPLPPRESLPGGKLRPGRPRKASIAARDAALAAQLLVDSPDIEKFESIWIGENCFVVEWTGHNEESFNEDSDSGTDMMETYITQKEVADHELAIRLRKEGIITTPGAPFEEARKKEVYALHAKAVFEFVKYNEETMKNIRIFKCRLVDEIRGKTTPQPIEKSRLVVQAHHDHGKFDILRQSPTFQRASQRLILALAPALILLGFVLWLRDIIQACVVSKSSVNRVILCRPPKEVLDLLKIADNMLMRILKPLYGIPEAGIHWFQTYHKHHRENLKMEQSTFDPCLLYTPDKKPFAIVGLQTDDSLGLSDAAFIVKKKEELVKAGYPHIDLLILAPDNPFDFNGGILTMNADRHSLMLTQKQQCKKLQLVDLKSITRVEEYLAQRARGAYIATVCQPEASFALSIAAQHMDPTDDDIKQLNKVLQWQIDHMDRGLHYVAVDFKIAKLFVYVDASFANNKDMSSHIGYTIFLANEKEGVVPEEFIMTGNLVYYASIKCRRVTRSILASELYAMVHGIDIAMAISTTLQRIVKPLGFPDVAVVVCTDSYSLYQCMVKMGSTKEKRLMIDIMAIRQSYERREIYEVRWINGADNPADAMTKAVPCKALQTFLDTNTLRVRMEGWVKR